MERQFDEQLRELREYLLAMGSLAETMIVKSVKALVDRSEALVQEVFAHEEEMDQRCIENDQRGFTLRAAELPMIVIEADASIDLLRDQVFRELLTYMMTDPTTIPRALDLILVSRPVERIADHATNIAEDVIYIVRGEDIRERGDKELRKGLRRPGERRETASRTEQPPQDDSGSETRLMPEESEFLRLLESSAHNVLEAARALQAMFDDYVDPEARWRTVEEAEHEGDSITHAIMKKLNQTFIPFIDRKNLHALASSLDDVVDGIETVASRMVMYKVEQPTPESREIVAIIVASVEQIVRAVSHLPRFDDVEAACVEINRLENAADTIYRESVAALFEGVRPVLEITKWKEIYETLEVVTDRCEDVADGGEWM